MILLAVLLAIVCTGAVTSASLRRAGAVHEPRTAAVPRREPLGVA